MGDEGGGVPGPSDDTALAFGHLILAIISGEGSRAHFGSNYTVPGMHTNFVVYGILGVIHNSHKIFDVDITEIFKISDAAARTLPLPCLMADAWRDQDQNISLISFLSGVIPFGLAVMGKENKHLEKVVLVGNIISLLYWSHERNREYGYYTAGAAAFTYFASRSMSQKFLYPVGLAVMDYCANRLFTISTTI